jgi:hypothetical protein
MWLTSQEILVLRSEMRRERERVLSQIFEFLGIDPGRRASVFYEKFLRMSGRRKRRRLFERAWHSPIPRHVAPFLPRRLKVAFRKATSGAVDMRSAKISTSFRRHLEGLLRDDVKQPYDSFDEGFDGWGIA